MMYALRLPSISSGVWHSTLQINAYLAQVATITWPVWERFIMYDGTWAEHRALC
jgi:hypothetical protein